MNPLSVHFFAKERNLTSVFSDGDGRILVGETVLTSAMNSYTPLFIQTIQRLMANNSTRIDYSGGFADGAAFVAPFGGAYWDNPVIRRIAEPLIEQELSKLQSRQGNGFCGVTALGITPRPFVGSHLFCELTHSTDFSNTHCFCRKWH